MTIHDFQNQNRSFAVLLNNTGHTGKCALQCGFVFYNSSLSYQRKGEKKQSLSCILIPNITSEYRDKSYISTFCKSFCTDRDGAYALIVDSGNVTVISSSGSKSFNSLGSALANIGYAKGQFGEISLTNTKNCNSFMDAYYATKRKEIFLNSVRNGQATKEIFR